MNVPEKNLSLGEQKLHYMDKGMWLYMNQRKLIERFGFPSEQVSVALSHLSGRVQENDTVGTNVDQFTTCIKLSAWVGSMN